MHARHGVRMHAVLTHVVTGWERTALVEDVGLGGVRLVVDEPLAAGDSVTLAFTAPSLWDPLVILARIVWVSDDDGRRRAGAAFEHQNAEAVFALSELIVTLGYE